MKKNNKNRKEKKGTNIMIYIILIFAILFLYSKYIEPFNINIKEYKINQKIFQKVLMELK